MTAITPARSQSPARLPVTPGRALALAVGVPVLLAAIGWTALNAVAEFGQGTFQVRDTIPVSGGQLTAQIDGGAITVRQAAATAKRAELTGTAVYSLFRSTATVSGSTVSYHCPFQLAGRCNLTAALQLPARTALSLSTYGGDVTVPGFTGRQLTLDTDGGNVNAGDLTGDLSLSTGGGDVTVAAVHGSLQARTDGGNVNIDAMRTLDPSIQSGGGDVFLAAAAAPDSVQITSDGGNVTLVLPPGQDGQYKVSMNAGGGSESNAVGDDSSANKSIVIDSGGGDITVSKAG
jgi:hypothetical protein